MSIPNYDEDARKSLERRFDGETSTLLVGVWIDGILAQGAEICIDELNICMNTGRSGMCSFMKVPCGTYHVSVDAGSFYDTKKITVFPYSMVGEISNMDFRF